MKICLDMRPALSQATGVGIYLRNLVRELSEIDTQNEYHLFYSSWKEDAPKANYGKNFVIHNQKWPVRVLNFAWHRLGWPPVDWLIRSEMDVVHSPGPLLIPTSNAHQITTVMDLYFYFYPEDTLGEIKRDYKSLVKKHSLRSDAIIAISEHTRQILIDRFEIHPSRIYLIRLAADPYFSESVSSESTKKILGELGAAQPYFLFVGGYEPRKNLQSALEAFHLLNEKDSRFVVVGHALARACNEKPGTDDSARIRFAGRVTCALSRISCIGDAITGGGFWNSGAGSNGVWYSGDRFRSSRFSRNLWRFVLSCTIEQCRSNLSGHEVDATSSGKA